MQCVKCQLLTFGEEVDLNGVSSVNSSLSGLFCIQKKDNSASILHLKQGNAFSVSGAGKFGRVFWDTHSSGSDQGGLFFTQDENGTLVEYAVVKDAIVLRRQLHFQPLKKAIEGYSQCSVSSIKLVGCEQGYPLFIVNSDTLCAAEINSNVCLPCTWIPLPTQEASLEGNGFSSFQISADAVAVLHAQAQLLFIYNLADGQLVCQIDLEPVGFSCKTSGGGDDTSACSIPWAASPALDKLFWLDQQGTMFSLDLQQYVRRKPHTVKLPENFKGSRSRVGVSQSVRTCRHGDFSWQQVLVDLHQQETGRAANTSWSHQKLPRLTTEQQSSKSLKTPACGFRGKPRSVSVKSQVDNYLQQFKFPSGSLLEVGYRVTELRSSRSTLALVLESGADENQRAVGLVDLKSQQVYMHDLPSEHFPVLTTSASHPMMLLSPEGLLMLVPPSKVDQEAIVSKMMEHSGAQSTDALCQLNGWGRTTVPLHALEMGLRQLQLDTVAFFLCAKEHLFSGNGSNNSSPTHHSTPWREETHLSTINDLLPALDLFLKVINNDLADVTPPRDFCLRLLIQTLEFLHHLLKDGLVRQRQLGGTKIETAEKEDLDRAMEVVMGYISKLRDAMLDHEMKQKKLARAVSMRSVGSTSVDTEKTDSMSMDSVDAGGTLTQDICSEDHMEKALRENDMPALQAQLLLLGRDVTAQWGEVVRVGLQKAWSHVQHQDISAAQFIISNLGLDVAKTVWDLTQLTTERHLQHYIIHQLKAATTLSSEDLSLVEFLQKLYTVYPSASVKHNLMRKEGSVIWSAENPMASHLRPVQISVSSEAKDIATSTTNGTASEQKEGPYCTMALHWLRHVDPEMREMILLDGTLLGNGSVEDNKFSNHQMWKFWLSRNQPQQAIQALETAIAAEKGMLGHCLEQYLHDLPLSAGFVQHHIKSHLLSKKNTLQATLQSLNPSVEQQLQMMKGLLHLPHPLHGCGSKALWEFHRQFAAYCSSYGFVVPLWRYCSVHGLDVESLLQIESTKHALWFKPFVHFYSAISQPDGCSKMFSASLSMASVTWKPDAWTLARLLREDHVTAAVATLAYLPETESVTGASNSDSPYTVDAALLRSSLQRFPKLLSALLPPDADTSRFDINVYQLLRDNAPLDSKRLFGWQSTNAIAAEDGMKILPYFSHPDLVSRFAHTAKLNFTYYLKHGRPSYAFLSFLSEELEHKTSTLSPKRVHAACGVALWLAVKHFHNPQISSACVAFVEMLGTDSIVLRTYIHAGETMLTHRVKNSPGPIEKRKEQMKASEQEVVSLMQSCLRNRHSHGRRLLSSVEDAIVDEIGREGLSSTSVEAALKWTLAIVICHHLHLPLTTRFLESCARDDRWLPFIWFGQLHQYPKIQLQQVLHQFPSRHLRDHFYYIITNASSNTVTSATAATGGDGKQGGGGGGSTADGNRSTRSSLYSKIGVKTSAEKAKGSSEEEEEEESRREEAQAQHKSSSRQSAHEDLDVTEESSASDVFRVIFSAMATSEPWKSLLMHAVVLRNPLFAELAGCLGAPMVSALCGWLVAMLSPSGHARFVEHHGKRVWKWTMSQLEKLMELYLQSHAENTLAAAFFIFQPISPLLPFLQFIAECVSWKNYEGCKLPLDNFKDSMASQISQTLTKPSSTAEKKRNSETTSTDPAEEVIGDRDWLEHMAYKVVHYELVHCSSLYDALHMLALLVEENIALVFSFDVLDFGHLHRMLEILHKNQVTNAHLPHLFVDKPEQRKAYLSECQKALESLMAQGVYEDAYTFGQCAGLDVSAVVLRHLESEKQQLKASGVWESPVIRQRYWARSGVRCTRFQLSPHTVADFFQQEADGTEHLPEKVTLFKLSLNHLETYQDDQDSTSLTALRDQIFTRMWQYRIQDRVFKNQKVESTGEPEDIFSEAEDTDANKKVTANREELLHKAALPKPQVDPSNELNSEEAMELERVMEELLSEGSVSECCHLARLLGGQSADLVVVLTCIGLSSGELTVATMDTASKLLLTTTERRPSLTSLASFSRVTSTVSLASAAPNWGFLPSAQEEIIFTMEQLLSRCRKSRPCCLRIISVYKIACLIGRSYKEVVMAEEFSVLRELLKTDFPQRYMLAAEFLSTSTLSDLEVASFLVDEIVKSLRIYLGGKDGFDAGTGQRGTSELIFRPTEGGEVFSQLVSLCAEPAILGDKLLMALAAMADTAPDPPSHSVLSMETELLIMAHECHTAGCNMEGISNVLRAARVCAQCLSAANQYQLMMRLLTGVGRYSEMTYVFDYLQQHHQFEMLLRKGIDKEDKLKTAILDYLKRFHSDDKDTYSMVALNFSMYREIAQMLDESGHRNLAMLKDKPLESNREIQDTLKKCLQYFKDAAESYVKDKCFMHAQKCLNWTRLVNLQLQSLGSGVKVINLSTEEVKAFVATHPKFIEAFIVSEAYGKAVDWSESVFTHVLLAGEMRYLQDFKSYVRLTPSLIESALYKFRQTQGKLASCLPQAKKLLKMCPDIWMQYKIAQDLGLQDVVKEMLRNDSSSSYIKDLINNQ
ncbi:spatacsin-like isoform X2 [Littorina saxatilis]|uniref:spatacsin-like isoform X2 n=1 Tax=Littorina saxatilis TaxID=31220 RepID=UPI0038B421EA